MQQVDVEQVLAFRVAGHNLHRRTDPMTAIAACGLQEFPPGWAAVALRARSTSAPDPAAVVTVHAMRGAPYVVPRADQAVFTTALVPDDDGLKSLLGTHVTKQLGASGHEPREALDRVAAAARDGLKDGPLERDDFHQALRERLPEWLLPWCRSCRSHHVAPSLWRALGPYGVTEMPARATLALAQAPEMELEAARAELARRFLRAYGPATHTQLASWAQTAPAHAKALLQRIADELEPVGRAFILAADAKRLQSPPKATGVRLLGGHDPYVGQPDRDALVPDAAVLKRMFPAVGRPGAVLVDGALAGVWSSRKKGDTLEVTVDWLGGATADLTAEAEAVAALRGCARVSLAA